MCLYCASNVTEANSIQANYRAIMERALFSVRYLNVLERAPIDLNRVQDIVDTIYETEQGMPPLFGYETSQCNRIAMVVYDTQELYTPQSFGGVSTNFLTNRHFPDISERDFEIGFRFDPDNWGSNWFRRSNIGLLMGEEESENETNLRNVRRRL